MNLDDESLLTAYLDGELTPRELLRVEAALRSDPSLAARVGELARVRELVASLPRPHPAFDLSRAIVPQLAAPPSRRGVLAVLSSRRSSYLDVALAAAAVLLATGFIGYLALLRDRYAPDRPAQTPQLASAQPAPSVSRPPRHGGRAEARIQSQSNTNRPLQSATGKGEGDADAHLAAQEQAQFQALIDSPNLKRIFFVVDAVGSDAETRVGEIVDSMPRADSVYACMTIVPNVTVDPKHPGGAKVFAVALTENELQQVRGKLRASFPSPGAVEENEPNAAVVTQLADVSRVEVLPGIAVADLESAAETEARIAAVKLNREGDDKRAAEAPVQGPTPEQLRSAPANYVERRQPAPAVARSAETAEAKRFAVERMKRNKASIVLIWVASR